jgi:1,4-alpha-glucan branching enzyme
VKKPLGCLALVLHTHLPYVRHPEHENFLEEIWLFEAMLETYLPLLGKLESLAERKIPFEMAVVLSPTLLAMWEDPLLQKRFQRYASDLAELSEREILRLKDQPEFIILAKMYLSRIREGVGRWEKKYRRDPAKGFQALAQGGNLELITCAATHGYLPLLGVREAAVRVQVQTALDEHERRLGIKSRGFWLPECGYQLGLERILAQCGVEYFFVDTHGLAQSSPQAAYGSFAPVLTSAGVAVLARDTESSKEVWSSKEGYPGDPLYRDFYRDIGFDLPVEDLSPQMKPEGLRRFTGLKYYRVTGGEGEKQPYDPARGLERARVHARDFLFKRVQQSLDIGRYMKRPPVMACMYDAELFGHWWFEGPNFIACLFEEAHAQGVPLEFTTPSRILAQPYPLQTVQPRPSSWGYGGYSEFWLNEANDWVYPLLVKACDRLTQAIQDHPRAGDSQKRAFNQALRELLLAQASDWPFMMKTGHHAVYAKGRIQTHLDRLNAILDILENGVLKPGELAKIERLTPLFPRLDYRVLSKS